MKVAYLVLIFLLFFGCVGGEPNTGVSKDQINQEVSVPQGVPGETEDEEPEKIGVEDYGPVSNDDVTVKSITWNEVVETTSLSSEGHFDADATIVLCSKRDDIGLTFLFINDVWEGKHLKQYVHSKEGFTHKLEAGDNPINIGFVGYPTVDDINEISFCFKKYDESDRGIREGEPGVICKTEEIESPEYNR